jgi:hypothetical protein
LEKRRPKPKESIFPGLISCLAAGCFFCEPKKEKQKRLVGRQSCNSETHTNDADSQCLLRCMFSHLSAGGLRGGEASTRPAAELIRRMVTDADR